MILANRNDHMSIKTSQAILKGCLENDDLENDDLQNDDLQNVDLENGDQFLKIIVKQKKIGKRKKKTWAEDLYKGKGRHLKRSLVRGEPRKLAGPVPVRLFRY